MPLFNYRCNNCGGSFEYLKISQVETVTCSKCSSSEVEKDFKPTSIAPVGLKRKGLTKYVSLAMDVDADQCSLGNRRGEIRVKESGYVTKNKPHLER
jgi:putative FmdB family regulatory protein